MQNLEPRPYKLPDAWPTDMRSRLVMTVVGWVIHHPDRESMAHVTGRWKPYAEAIGAAA